MLTSELEITDQQPHLQPQDGGFVGQPTHSLAPTMPVFGSRLLNPKNTFLATVAFVGKGGGGKTSACANLATIAHRLNLGAGIADADPQGSSCDWRRARRNNDVRVRPCDPEHLEECVELARQAGLQWLFVDMPPGSRYALAASRVADLTLILTRPTFFDVRVTEHVIDLMHSTPSNYGIVINAAPPRRNGADSTMVRDTREALAAVRPRLWSRQITHRLAVPSAVISGKGVIESDPNSLAAQEYCALWNAIVAEIQRGRSHQ